MNTSTALPAVLRTIHGVESVKEDAGKMVVEYKDGKVVTVARCPLSAFAKTESFDLYLPPSRAGFAADIAPSKSAEEVIVMLNKLAAKAAV